MEKLEPVSEFLWLKRRSSSFRLLLTVGLATWSALLLVSLWNLFIFNSPHHDQTWFLYAAQRMIAGAKLYGPGIAGPGIVETNPPLIIWFSAIPVELARLLHLGPVLMLKLVVLAAVVGSMMWSYRILRAAGWKLSPGFLSLALCSILTAELFLDGFEVGQREHLLVILFIPYLLSSACIGKSDLSLAERCAIGVAGGVAVCIKPQEVLILFGVELFLVLWRRPLRRVLRAELLCAASAILLYTFLVYLVTPLYFTKTTPLLMDCLWAYGGFKASFLFRAAAHANIVLLLALIVFVLCRRRLRYSALSGSFLACAIGASLAYFLQHTGWAYQIYPYHAFLVLAVLWIGFGLAPAGLDNWRPRLSLAVGAFALALAFLVPLLLRLHIRQVRAETAQESYVQTALAGLPPQTPVLVLSTSLDAFPTVLEEHLTWASRFAHLWMLPAIIQNERAQVGGPKPKKVLSPGTVQRLAELQRTEVAEDLLRWKPDVVVVSKCRKSAPCQALGDLDFDIVSWFGRSAAFAAQWSHYRIRSSSADYDVYQRSS